MLIIICARLFSKQSQTKPTKAIYQYIILSFMINGKINLYSDVRPYFHFSQKYNCHAGVFMTLTLFCTPAYLNKRNVTFIKHDTNGVNMTTSWRYCSLCFNVFGCFSLNETENLLNYWCKIKIYFISDHRKSYFHSWPRQENIAFYDHV